MGVAGSEGNQAHNKLGYWKHNSENNP